MRSRTLRERRREVFWTNSPTRLQAQLRACSASTPEPTGSGIIDGQEAKQALILRMERKRETRRRAACGGRPPVMPGAKVRTLAAASKTVFGDNLLRVFVDEGESGALGREFEF